MKESVDDRDGRIVFETPKKDGLANDVANMEYFRGI
jgi:hypothetical protein